MADRKAFALRISAKVIEGMQRWADDDLRSLNAQIEFVLRDALLHTGRMKTKKTGPVLDEDESHGE